MNIWKLLALMAWEDLGYTLEEEQYIIRERRKAGLSDWPDADEIRRDTICFWSMFLVPLALLLTIFLIVAMWV